MVSLIEKLRQARAERTARDAEPWRLPLERLHGKIGDDGIERITTQLLFDILEVPQRSRGAGACRRLAKLMAELGWTAVRVRGLTRGGYWSRLGVIAVMLGTSSRCAAGKGKNLCPRLAAVFAGTIALLHGDSSRRR